MHKLVHNDYAITCSLTKIPLVKLALENTKHILGFQFIYIYIQFKILCHYDPHNNDSVHEHAEDNGS